MSTPILTTKLYTPRLRPNVVSRPRLIELLNEGLQRKLILISAPPGFGKTTLVSEWVASHQRPTAWLSLDEGDNDPARFLTYLVAAWQTLAATPGAGGLRMLQSSQPPSTEAVLTALLNDITTTSEHFVLVLDDYHVIDAQPVHHALTFLLEHLPSHMHLVIATREEPSLPLARLRVQDQLSELRAIDLRFAPSEATEFLTQRMGLHLSAEDIAALERRTEGWIAGLHLAAISMRGHPATADFIRSFTGSHHFVLDYLVEEVLQQQPERVQQFLLHTSLLDRLCGPLCDAILGDSSASGQATLEYLEHANLFVVPLDNEQRWYRYHHLFADVLRQRLRQSIATSSRDAEAGLAELHLRASAWYENHGLELEAFRHAVAANHVEHAARLLEGKGMPLHFRGAVAPVLHWLESLPETVLDARPSLWVMYASVLSMTGQLPGVEPKLQAAEAALQNAEPNETTRNLIGHIAAIRALLAATQYQVEAIIVQSRRALEYLHPDNLPVRTATAWKLGLAYQIKKEYTAASQAYSEAISLSQASGNIIICLSATAGLGATQEAENQLPLANRTYQRVLQLAGEPPLPVACEGYAGLARICYEWNDLESARQHVQQSIQLARQIESMDRSIISEVFLARLKLAQGDIADAAALLAEVSQSVRQQNFLHRMPEIAAVQVLTLLCQGNLAAAADLAQAHQLPLSQARVHLAQRNSSAALAVLEPWRQQAEAREWQGERLRTMVLQAVALEVHGARDRALQQLFDALVLAEPGGFVRLFVDEGLPMVQLLSRALARGLMPNYVEKLLTACKANAQKDADPLHLPVAQPLIEPLSQRELEVLRLVAQGCSNQEIGEQLFLALDTVKGHNRSIFSKLQVQRRTEAVARARELGLL